MDPAILDFYAELPQQGPGRDGETLGVLGRFADRLPARPVVADLGCGTGRATLALAQQLPDATITAVDLSAAFCRRLEAEAARRGLSQRIRVRQADMAAPPLLPGSLDVLWCEGAAYVIGFAEALKLWRPLLKADGFAVISECTWLSDARPADVANFWAAAYPAMGTQADNIARAASTRYTVIDTHTLPTEAWDDYYAPMAQAITDGRAMHLGSQFVAELDTERAVLAAGHGSFGYVFYTMKPRPNR
jgi:serine/threonine-protein kinase HipA